MSPYKLIIFDCDGVIVDSEPLSAEVICEMTAELGLQMTPGEAQHRFNGRKVAEWVKELEDAVGHPLADKFIPEFRQRSAEKFRKHLQPVTGIKSLLDNLSVPFCLASSGPLEKISLTLTRTGLMSYFEGRIFSGYEVGVWKPDPGLFLHAAKACNANPADCAVIEDSHVGVEAGLAAGMTVFHYQPENTVPAMEHDRLFRFSAMTQLNDLLTDCKPPHQALSNGS